MRTRCNVIAMTHASFAPEPARAGVDPAPVHPALDVWRARFHADSDAEALARTRLQEQPGRAAGRVAAWSLSRAFDALFRSARRQPAFAAPGDAPTLFERQLVMILDALGRDDDALARAGAEFVLRQEGVEAFLERLRPAARALRRGERQAA